MQTLACTDCSESRIVGSRCNYIRTNKIRCIQLQTCPQVITAWGEDLNKAEAGASSGGRQAVATLVRPLFHTHQLSPYSTNDGRRLRPRLRFSRGDLDGVRDHPVVNRGRLFCDRRSKARERLEEQVLAITKSTTQEHLVSNLFT